MFLTLVLFAADFTTIQPPCETASLIQSGFAFTEGPAWSPEGELFFSDIPRNQILRMDKSGRITVFRSNSGGANGLAFDHQGRLIACEGRARRVTRTEKDGSITVLAAEWKGKRLNSPNDLALDSSGRIYFTDPRYGSRHDMEMDVEAVWRIDPDGTLTRLITDLKKPNGIAVSPDSRTLYVADNGADCVVAYPLKRNGSIGKGRVLCRLTGGPDGMAVDAAGRLYVTGPAGIWVFSPRGALLGIIEIPRLPANVCFGGPELKTIFVTARTDLYRVKLAQKGLPLPPSIR